LHDSVSRERSTWWVLRVLHVPVDGAEHREDADPAWHETRVAAISEMRVRCLVLNFLRQLTNPTRPRIAVPQDTFRIDVEPVRRRVLF
jgi:hypothetical protein